jgi:hypothetical protein
MASVNVGSWKRLASSSGVGSSTRSWIHQRFPSGSRTRPTRSPQASSVSRVTGVAPAATARPNTASPSSTYSRSKPGVATGKGESNIMMTDSPIRASACPMAPPSTSTRPSSSASKACLMNSSRRRVSLVTTQGVTDP